MCNHSACLHRGVDGKAETKEPKLEYSKGEPSVSLPAPTEPAATGKKKHWQGNESLFQEPFPSSGGLWIWAEYKHFPWNMLLVDLSGVAIPTAPGLRNEDRRGGKKLA